MECEMGRPREDVTPDDLRSAQKWLIGLSDQCGQMARMLEQANMPLAFLHWNGVTGTYGNNLQIAIDQAMIDVETHRSCQFLHRNTPSYWRGVS